MHTCDIFHLFLWRDIHLQHLNLTTILLLSLRITSNNFSHTAKSLRITSSGWIHSIGRQSAHPLFTLFQYCMYIWNNIYIYTLLFHVTVLHTPHYATLLFPLQLVKTSTNRKVDNQNVDKPKRRQTETSTNRNVDKPKRRQTKTSTDQNVDKPQRRQTKTSTDRNVDKPKRRQFCYLGDGIPLPKRHRPLIVGYTGISHFHVGKPS